MEESWTVEALNLVPNILSSSSCLHVALLVFLRLLAIEKPLKYQEIHIKLRHVSIVVIWSPSICVCAISVFIERFQDDRTLSTASFDRVIVLHGLHTIPITCIIIFYIKLILTLARHGRRHSVATLYYDSAATCRAAVMDMKAKQMRIMKGVVACLIVCYLPYLSWWEYSIRIVAQRKPFKVYKFEVFL